MPNALALLGLNQFEKLERFNQHRQKIAKIYDKELSFVQVAPEQSGFAQNKRVCMRYSVFVENSYCPAGY